MLSILTPFFLITLALAAVAQTDIQYLTGLVSDLAANGPQYATFLNTATSIPNDVILLYANIRTYTDDSYTTLLQNPNLNFNAVKSFLSQFPGHTRFDVIATPATATATAASTTVSSNLPTPSASASYLPQLATSAGISTFSGQSSSASQPISSVRATLVLSSFATPNQSVSTYHGSASTKIVPLLTFLALLVLA